MKRIISPLQICWKLKDGGLFISDWLRNRNTIEFLGIWEQIHNPNFYYGEFAIIKSQVGLNSYKISIKEWVAKTNAIGLKATAGRYGGTYAYNDIAFEFGMRISPEFKIYLIKEFERLTPKNSSSSDEISNVIWQKSIIVYIQTQSRKILSRLSLRHSRLTRYMPAKRTS